MKLFLDLKHKIIGVDKKKSRQCANFCLNNNNSMHMKKWSAQLVDVKKKMLIEASFSYVSSLNAIMGMLNV